ncbi:Zn-dependent protease with chaperone function [Actinocorallia herbida]|uniref:Zn-dependent protease with chaperone function n=1 Tax=Actinocorallia herbida TaxID=58109 RepID=A0A3N1D7H4_9ACTN|nr:M48 family metallopeptidase [Actinocorallia herbida]ROO89446.1 Zn-dependent protease with chaperone function [Actinocorallia herbida]
MTQTPDRARRRFPGISSRAYEHPLDRSALVALRSLSGFDTILRKLAGLISERQLRLMFLSGAVRANEQQFRHLHEVLRDACYILDLPKVPELYVTQSPMPNAMAVGTDNPFIVVNTALLDLMDEEELRFVVAHEAGHILSGHAVYRQMALILTGLGSRLSWLPLGNVAIGAILIGLQEWQRKSELSADRAGLLAGQDVEAAKRALMKLAGGSRLHEMSTEAFLAQAREYEESGDLRDGVLKFLNLMKQSHPFAVIRFGELHRWHQTPEYTAIMAGEYPRREDDGTASFTEEVKNAARSYKESWEQSGDPLVGRVRDAAGGAADLAGAVFDRFGRRSQN